MCKVRPFRLQEYNHGMLLQLLQPHYEFALVAAPLHNYILKAHMDKHTMFNSTRRVEMHDTSYYI